MKRFRFTPDERGAVLPLTAMMIAVAVWCMALAIDLGHLYLVKCELQRGADAGAMAAALGLFAVPPGAQNPTSRGAGLRPGLQHLPVRGGGQPGGRRRLAGSEQRRHLR